MAANSQALPTRKSLAATRERLDEARQSWTFLWRPYHRLARPSWARGRDTPFECIYQDYKSLLRSGAVVWGHIVQANMLLFKSGRDDHPANAVFSMDPFFDDKLPTLAELSGVMFGLKGRDASDPELDKFARAITNEYKVLMNRKLPLSLTFERKVYFTTIMVHRKHLPERVLSASWFPLLASPKETKASIILPSRYWDPDLLEMWQSR